MSKRNSIYFQLLRQLILSAVISAVVFAGLDFTVSYLIGRYFENPFYVERQNEKYAGKLQKYVTREGLSTKDGEALSRWVKKQNILYVQIYKDSILVFDSAYPEEDIWEEEIMSRDYELDYHSRWNFRTAQEKCSLWEAMLISIIITHWRGNCCCVLGCFCCWYFMGSGGKWPISFN